MRTSAVLLVFGLCAGLSWSQFLNNKPWPTYSLENMPDTEFSCRDKILGGYYADPQTQCQMFHICVKVAGVGIQDFRFLCPNGTAFDQDHQICADWEDVDCDATTLYYSSDNFDLYRIGSGFESKAVKYGEDEEFSLQRADTGDARLNREHQTQRVNQQFETNNNFNRKTNNNNNNNYNNNNNNNNNNKHRSQQQDDDREIFRGSSSSNFFNNRNNGKENDDDYDDSNVNINQDRDEIQRKKVVKTQHRRPNYRTTEAPRTREPITEAPEQPRQTTTIQPVRRNKSPNIQQRNNNYQQDYEEQTIKPQRPSGFTNNFAGSFPSTTSRPTSTTLTNEQYTKAVNNYRSRNQRVRVQNDRQYNNAENFRQNQNTNQEAHSQTPVYTVSTPAPFRQTQYKTKTANFNHYNSPTATTTTTTTTTTRPVVESYTTTLPPKSPSSFSTKNYNQKSSTSSKQTTPFKQTENYPINNPKYNNNFEKKQPLTVKNENYPTTYAPKTKNSEKYNKNKEQENYPTTFAPKANSAYSQTQTTQHKNSQNTQYFNPPVPSQSRKNNQENFNKDPTPKTSPFTRYTPTVPKISSTTPTSRSQGRSSRYDETEYDDGSYDTKFDKEDLNTAHSQNIAASRNEFLKNTKPPQQRTTHKQVQQPKPTPAAAVTKKQNQQKATQPRPFSASPNTPKVTERPKQVATSTIKSLPERPKEIKKQEAPKTKKDYDYAYYDSNNEHEYDLQYHTELKKSTANN